MYRSSRLPNKDIHISKTLSWLLRHGAVKEKLRITEDGFMNVADILRHKSFKTCTIDDIKRIVANDNKRRYTLRTSDNTLEVRANQGHSLQEVNALDLKPLIRPEELSDIIHGTFYRAWDSIRQNGLSRMNRNHIHFASGLPNNDNTVISGMRRSCEIFIFVDAKSALSAGIKFCLSSNGVILSTGNEQGLIETKHFVKVLDAKTVLNMAGKKSYICETCQIKVKGLLAYHNHLLSPQHANKLNRNAMNEKIGKCGIHVLGFPAINAEEGLMNVFSRLGKIEEIFIGDGCRFAHILFENEYAAQKALTEKIFYQGKRLIVKRRIIQSKQLVTNEHVLNIIQKCSNLDCQILCLHKHLQLPTFQIKKKYENICNDLRIALNGTFPNCKVWPFGSTITGFSLHESDVDVFVEVEPTSTCNTETDSLPYIKRAKNALQKNRLFTQIFAVTNAKTPILKCVHMYSRLNCDINFKNKLGVCNSELIKFLLLRDCRLHSTMFIIKCWAKVHDLSGGSRITNYALTMLFIFYLQQGPDPLCPAIATLQTPGTESLQHGWNAGFSFDEKNLPPVPSTLTIPQLLRGFFNYYKKFDFAFNVISPLSGCCHSRFDFTEPETLPHDIFYHYMNMVSTNPPLSINRPMCLQDPFELTHNVTAGVPSSKLQNFQEWCTAGAEICRVALANSEEDILLQKVFSKLNVPPTDLLNFNVTIYADNFFSYAKTKVDATIENKLEYVHKMWFEEVHSFVDTVFKKIFLCDVSRVDPRPRMHKLQKMNEQSDVHDMDMNHVLTYNCVTFTNVTSGRKLIQKSLNFSQHMNVLEREIAVTNHIPNATKAVSVDKPIAKFELILKQKLNPTQMEVTIIPIIKNNNYYVSVMQILLGNLVSWFRKYMAELTGSDNCSTDGDVKGSTESLNVESQPDVPDSAKKCDDDACCSSTKSTV